MAGIGGAGRLLGFIAAGIAAIAVGAFMIRGTMHLWDRPDESDKS